MVSAGVVIVQSETAVLLDPVRKISPIETVTIVPVVIAAVVVFLAKHMALQIIHFVGLRGVYPDEAFITGVRKQKYHAKLVE